MHFSTLEHIRTKYQTPILSVLGELIDWSAGVGREANLTNQEAFCKTSQDKGRGASQLLA